MKMESVMTPFFINGYSKRLNMKTSVIHIEGNVEEVKPPKFSSKQGFYVVGYKVSGKWKYVWRRRETKSNEVYEHLCTLRDETKAKIHRKTTSLTEEQLKECEIVIQKLTYKYGERDTKQRRLLTDAVDLFIKRTPTLYCPYVEECVEMFMDYKKGMLSPITLRDYGYILNRFKLVFGETRINELTTKEVREYIEDYDNRRRRATHQYLHSFLQFCGGKDNPYIEEGKGWMDSNPITWKIPQQEYSEPEVLSFRGIVNLLMLASTNSQDMTGIKANNKFYSRDSNAIICYYVWRLFSMIRREEYIRLIKCGGKDIISNKYIDLERRRLRLTPDIYKKKGSVNRFGSGRMVEPISDTFWSWIQWMIENSIPLSTPLAKYGEYELKKVKEQEGLKGTNVLRHTAITYHILKFKNLGLTSRMAGTSLNMIQNHYLAKNIPTIYGEQFYELDVKKAAELNIIKV